MLFVETKHDARDSSGISQRNMASAAAAGHARPRQVCCPAEQYVTAAPCMALPHLCQPDVLLMLLDATATPVPA